MKNCIIIFFSFTKRLHSWYGNFNNENEIQILN